MSFGTISVERSSELVPYTMAEQKMQHKVRRIFSDNAPGKLWLLEHPSLYTTGVSMSPKEEDDNTKQSFIESHGRIIPLHYTSRGGKHTYHGPGQRVVYTMLNLRTLYGAQPDLRQFVKDLTQWVIRTLVSLGVEAGTHPQHVGIWIGQQKIAALGIRLHKWVSYHGIAININPDMTFFESIVPCGISDLGVGSLASLGYHIDMQAFDTALLESFPSIFNIDIESVTDESIV